MPGSVVGAVVGAGFATGVGAVVVGAGDAG